MYMYTHTTHINIQIQTDININTNPSTFTGESRVVRELEATLHEEMMKE